jgi:hypothetical protein
MKARKRGKRHPLLIYRRMMDRLWSATFTLGMILFVLWTWTWISPMRFLHAQENNWLMVASCVLLAFTAFAFFGRKVAYVQAYGDHLRVVTPFLRTHISYRRIHKAHPAEFQRLFPPSETSWAQDRLLSPFYGKTALVLELKGYPLPRFLLRFFLAPQMFLRHGEGLVILVPDWMTFSTEIDSFRGHWVEKREQKRRRQAAPGWMY